MGVHRRRGHGVAQKEVKRETRLGVTDPSGHARGPNLSLVRLKETNTRDARTQAGKLRATATVLVVRRVLRLRQVSVVHQRRVRRREYLRQGLRGYRARRMLRDDWPVLCAGRKFA